MKKYLKVKKKLQNFSSLLICLLVLCFQSNSQILYALSMDNYQSELVIEELRLTIPSNFKEVWLMAEKKVWDKKRPKSLGKSKALTAAQKDKARARAKRAGRKYPNLVDNMWAANQ